jgi:hypothetical protein
MGKIPAHPDRHCSSPGESNNYQSFSIILIIVGLFLVGCTNYTFSVNNPDSRDESLIEIPPDEEDIDFHGREYKKWDSRADYYQPRKSSSVDNYYLYGNSLQSGPVPNSIGSPDLCYYTAKVNVNCRVSDYIESTLIAILMQGEQATLLSVNSSHSYGMFELVNLSQCWIFLELMDVPCQTL